MKRSIDRILTTHAGSLPRPEGLLELYRGDAARDELDPILRDSVAEVVRRQAEYGIDIVNDGEFGKPASSEVDFAAWVTYMYERLEGYEMRDIPVSKFSVGRDQRDFADYYASADEGDEAFDEDATFKAGVAVGPISYRGQEMISRDIQNLQIALEGVAVADAIMMAVTPEFAVEVGPYYPRLEDEVAAVADALREEYRAITDAGIGLQIDDPVLVNMFEWGYSESWDLASFRKWAEGHIERVNYALEGIPPEMVRYHVCWGSWKGPHSSDLPLKDVIDLVLKVNASQFSVEGANAQHEHEWVIWNEIDLPDGCSVVPGVVSHKTNVLEHPELVAQRIVRYAEAVGRENVIAGTDCGLGGRIHPSLAWAKLQALSEGAAIASRQLWGSSTKTVA